ncbi:N-formylglutamate deformylase [Putridiphycobacter roseus]|uniref:N-formylglutamate deformylase n=1 Tax=Putridiphycobacter roseus TaxID=2219161 RepID=A0A2W1MVL2_9FLAO|nr:N-formylglutamate amidohydrolase [Putridiphycobacter roseus]PZE16139.1 N-formylglutamate deformylase [Putridiphycobacter roseus]
MPDPFYIIEPKAPKVPIIISVPHSGTDFPEEIKQDYLEGQLKVLDDTDWNVEEVYDFASELGITVIHAKYSRWVIDLNRDPESKPLYNDGRIITGLCSYTDFFGRPIYKAAQDPNQEEVERRLKTYYWTYYQKVQALLDERKAEFGKVLLWDAHSIRHLVPSIQKEPFPDMILGNNDHKTADQEWIETAINTLRKGPFQVNHNTPFKGGHITRYFGKPAENQHALQLEMNKILYMNEEEMKYDTVRASIVKTVLKPVFQELIKAMA